MLTTQYYDYTESDIHMQIVRISLGCSWLCWSHYGLRVRLQDWLHSGNEFSIEFKVNYMSEDLLPVTVTSR